ncbi:hypothetical protein GGR57DRAFT_513839 [Xylariaceae sp. FL1272]|nr:hypothetical protein GGR57DRAFT_513839 [Xylariaceae sp. FL1272]
MTSSYIPIANEERFSTETLRLESWSNPKGVEHLPNENAEEGAAHYAREQCFIPVKAFVKSDPWWKWPLLNSVLLMCAIAYYFFKYATVTTDASCQRKLWAFSPIQEAMEFEWRQYDSDVVPPDLYGIPTQESRELWANAYNNGTIAFPYDKLREINKSTEAFEWWTRPPPLDDEVVAILEGKSNLHLHIRIGFSSKDGPTVAHQYHCVSLLWWFQYRHRWDFAAATNMTEEVFRLHTNHCNLALMTMIKCQADVTPVLFRKDASDLGAWKTSDAPHRCKKFGGLVEWQREHSICKINCQPNDLQ